MKNMLLRNGQSSAIRSNQGFLLQGSFASIRVHLRLIPLGFVLVMAASVLAQGGKTSAPVKPSGAATYKDIQPILKARCVVCHNQEALTNTVVSGGLALDTYAAFKKGVVMAKSAHAVFVAGKSADSELIKRLVTTSPTKLMPKGGPPLPAAQVALFKKWVDAGAPGPEGDETKTKAGGADILPMPAIIGTQDVSLKTRIALTPDLLGKTPPKDPALAFALKIGPLPPLTAIAFAPDGKRLAVGGYRAVIIWDTTTGQPIASLTGLAGPIQSLAFRPDGAQLAIAGGNAGVSGEVKIVDAKTLASAGPILAGHSDVVFSVAWNSDGTRLITGSQDKTARLWEWPSGKEKMVFKDHSDAVTKVCFAPDGKSVYTGSLDHNARRFDINDGKVLKVFTGHGDGITALAVSPKGDNLLTAGPEPEIRWWNTGSGDNTNKQGGHVGPVNDIVFSKDVKLIASAGADHTIRLWDGGNGGQKRALEGANDWMYAVAISPDDKFVAGAGADGMVRLWEAESGRLRLSLVAWPPVGKSTMIEYAAITPEGYFDASPAWAARMRPQLAPLDTPLPKLAAWVQTLKQPESIAKSWQGAPLDPAKLDAPKPTPPVTPPVKPAPTTTPPTKVDPKIPAKSK